MPQRRPSVRRLGIAAGLTTITAAAGVSTWAIILALGRQSQNDDAALLSNIAFGLLVLFWAIWFGLYLIDSRRLARRTKSALVYSRNAADRSRRMVDQLTVLLDRPAAMTTDQLDQRVGRLNQLLEANHSATVETTKTTTAIILDDLERHSKQLDAIRNDSGQVRDDVASILESTNKPESQHATLSDAELDRMSSSVEKELQAFAGRFYPLLEGLVGTYFTSKPSVPLGSMRGWAISPDLASFLLTTTYRTQPKLIVETGSGISTVLFAMALARQGNGQVIALEHEPTYLRTTEEMLHDQGVSDFARVVHAPLIDYEINDHRYSWYNLTDVDIGDSIDLLFIDGPPGRTGQNARFPALPLLKSRISDSTLIILDDAGRPDEAATINSWSEQIWPMDVEFLPHEKGTALIRKRHESA